MADGTIARKTKAVSELGARLDTLADSVFVAVCFVATLSAINEVHHTRIGKEIF